LVLAGQSRKEADRSVGEMLERVSLTAGYAARFPDQLSGGERQRVAIARALVSRPEMLVCDEVTSALDVLVQAAIVELLADLRNDLGLSMVFVTHNLPLVRSIAERVVVLADGRVVESGNTVDVLGNPQEEYTKKLLADTPRLSAATQVPEVDWTA
jgi:peptide/nickel transport system ATP-binding protein